MASPGYSKAQVCCTKYNSPPIKGHHTAYWWSTGTSIYVPTKATCSDVEGKICNGEDQSYL